MAGYLTPLAFRAAADPARFPEHLSEGLRPWQPRKLYVGAGFRPAPSSPPTLQVQTGGYDPVIGRSFAEVAMEGRSQHKSQQMGVLEVRGPRASDPRLVDGVVEAGTTEQDAFEGLDVSIPGLARLAGLPPGTLETELRAIDRAGKRALADLDVETPSRIIPALVAGLRAVRAARRALETTTAGAPARAEADFLLEHKEREFESALVRAAGIVVDVLADAEVVARGESFGVTVRAYLAAPATARLGEVALVVPSGWRAVPGDHVEPADRSPFARFFRESPDRQESFRVTVSPDAPATQPYWLTESREGEVFPWPEGGPGNRPFAAALVHGRIVTDIGGVSVDLVRPLQYRFADPVRGELRRNVHVVPAITVTLDSDLEVVPVAGAGVARRIAVRIENRVSRTLAGQVRLTVPDGWTSTPVEAPFTLDTRGARITTVFSVTPSARLAAGSHRIRATAIANGERFDTTMQTVAYPHIQTHRLYRPAEALVQVVDLQVAPVTVGYIMGSGDRVPEAIERMGLEVAMLDADELRAGDLSRFDTIVVGVRASEALPDFVGHHARLLDYVRAGGTLVVQYQQTGYVRWGLTPYPAEMRSRVSDERAPVRILEPDHPVFTFPNRITGADWDGWVQERNLYAFTGFDDRFTPLLESRDPGEAAQQGGQVYARLGRGHYVYTAYAWFRQLPAGVPGAYRMFANLLSLPKAPAGSG